MRKLRFVWVDDDPRKISDYREAIEQIEIARRRADVEPIHVKAELLQTLDTWISKHQQRKPDLFLIDQVFNAALPFKLDGSSVAHLLRNSFPKTPMVCVSAQFDSPKSFNQEDLSEYTTVFVYSQLDRHLEDLFRIALDFPKLEFKSGSAGAHLVRKVKAPKNDQEKLLMLLPEEFRSATHPATQHRMARWVYNVLLKKPGFLYDELHVATLLGLTTKGFEKVRDLFAGALYTGVFATQSYPKWWVSKVQQILFNQESTVGVDTPQLAGRTLPGLSGTDFSVCYVSRKSNPPPDTVVFVDTTKNSKVHVVQREFAKQHPDDPGTNPGFEMRYVLAKRRS